jgi:chaperone BCS1
LQIATIFFETTKANTVEPFANDDQKVCHLASELERCSRVEDNDENLVLRRAAARVEIDRSARNPNHWKRQASRWAKNPEQLNMQLQALFNRVMHIQFEQTGPRGSFRPFETEVRGYGYGSWVSWWLPIVWISPQHQEYPAWFDDLPPSIKQLAVRYYNGLFPPAESDKSTPGGNGHETPPNLDLVLTTFTWQGLALIRHLIDQADYLEKLKNSDESDIRRQTAEEGDWDKVAGPPRRMDTVMFGPEARELNATIEEFLDLNARERFASVNMPYQRVFLLHGPPGNGKSSILNALAIKLGFPQYVLQMTGLKKEADLKALLAHCQSNCMVCVEDAESAFDKRGAVGQESDKPAAQIISCTVCNYPRIQPGTNECPSCSTPIENQPLSAASLAKLIQEGHGDTVPDRRLVFFTTNYLERLHPALRKLADDQGRSVLFPNCTESMVRQMFSMFYQQFDDVDAHAETFWRNFSRLGLSERASGAALSQYFLRYRDDYHAALANVALLAKELDKLKGSGNVRLQDDDKMQDEKTLRTAVLQSEPALELPPPVSSEVEPKATSFQTFVIVWMLAPILLAAIECLILKTNGRYRICMFNIYKSRVIHRIA